MVVSNYQGVVLSANENGWPKLFFAVDRMVRGVNDLRAWVNN